MLGRLMLTVGALVGIGGPVGAVVLGQIDNNSGGTVSIALLSAGLGALGVVLSGKIVVPTFAYNREKDRADKWEGEALRLSNSIADRHVPALDAASHAVTEGTKAVTAALSIIEKMT